MSCGCNPCKEPKEPMPSSLENLTSLLFGSVTKTIDRFGKYHWSTPCTGSETVSSLPRNEGEGFICYIIRVAKHLGMVFEGEWNDTKAYVQNNLATYSYAIYRAKTDNTNLRPDLFPEVWELVVRGIAGPQGQPGPQGPSGSTPLPQFTPVIITSDTTLTDSHDAVLCKPTADMNIYLPLQEDLMSGKYFYIETNGAFKVIVSPTSPETINSQSSTELVFDGECVFIVSNGQGDWRIL